MLVAEVKLLKLTPKVTELAFLGPVVRPKHIVYGHSGLMTSSPHRPGPQRGDSEPRSGRAPVFVSWEPSPHDPPDSRRPELTVGCRPD